MAGLLEELLSEAVDSEGNPIPKDSIEAKFIIESYNHVLAAEDTDGEPTFNVKKKATVILKRFGVKT